jgi:epoxyqueuosine reductase
LSVDKLGTGVEKTITGLTADHARAFALAAGFSEAGLVVLPYADEARNATRFAEWVKAGRAGSMSYLTRMDEAGKQFVRAKVGTPFPWARSAIVCLANYNSAAPRSIAPAAPGSGWIARYAWSSRVDANGVRRPSDYHKVLKKRLQALESRLHKEFGEFEARAYVDTGPLVERSLATAAGLGWTGKNTCLIHPKLGSFGFLGVLLTSLETDQKSKTLEVPDRCGSCRRCIEACPTDALIAPYQMDAAKCIAYLTIEHKGPIAPELMEDMGRQVFGCDICQDVCPWNRKAPVAVDGTLPARRELVNPALEWLGAMDGAKFNRWFRGSPLERTRRKRLMRNVAIAMGNSGEKKFLPRLEEWAAGEDTVLAESAAWAVRKISGVAATK